MGVGQPFLQRSGAAEAIRVPCCDIPRFWAKVVFSNHTGTTTILTETKATKNRNTELCVQLYLSISSQFHGDSCESDHLQNLHWRDTMHSQSCATGEIISPRDAGMVQSYTFEQPTLEERRRSRARCQFATRYTKSGNFCSWH
jgi:hypothetical protein